MQTNEIIAIIVSSVVALIGIIAVVYFGDDTGADEDTSTSDSPINANGASADTRTTRLDERVHTLATEVGADLDSINTDLSSQTGLEREAITTIGSVASGTASVPEAPPDAPPEYQHPENQLVMVPAQRMPTLDVRSDGLIQNVATGASPSKMRPDASPQLVKPRNVHVDEEERFT